MYSVSVNLTSSEWDADSGGGEAVPQGNAVPAETVRRYALADVDALQQISEAERARLVYGFQASMEASDERLRH